MHLRILKSFMVEGSPHPLLPGELITINDATAQKWIADGRAAKFEPVAAVPARRTREKAIRA